MICSCVVDVVLLTWSGDMLWPCESCDWGGTTPPTKLIRDNMRTLTFGDRTISYDAGLDTCMSTVSATNTASSYKLSGFFHTIQSAWQYFLEWLSWRLLSDETTPQSTDHGGVSKVLGLKIVGGSCPIEVGDGFWSTFPFQKKIEIPIFHSDCIDHRSHYVGQKVLLYVSHVKCPLLQSMMSTHCAFVQSVQCG